MTTAESRAAAPFRLDGRVALVTGAGTGIGWAVAETLATAGLARLYLAGRRLEKLTAAAAAVRAAAPGCDVVVVAGDLARPDARQALVTRVAADGRLDCLVNNAGVFAGAPLRETTDAAWAEQLAINVTAPFALTRDLVALLARAPDPAVVNIASTLAIRPIPNTVAYAASKAALMQLTRALAFELGRERIRVNCLLPAVVDTPMQAQKFSDAAAYRRYLADAVGRHPLGRVGSPRDVALAALFLASPAASWISGAALPVDGGLLAT